MKSRVLYSLLGKGDRHLTYVSGLIHAGEVGMIKEWSTVRLSCAASGIFKVIMDNTEVINEIVGGSANFKIPKGSNKGRYIQFKFEGVGEIYNIEYTLGGQTTTK